MNNDLSKPLVLVVDDEPANISVISQCLIKQFKIKVSKTGKKAFQILEKDLPDLILLDIMLPDIDGFSICKKLKSDPRTQDIPIIMVTGKTDAVDVISGLELGAADYITKPFNHGILLARVNTHIRIKMIWDQLQEKNRLLEEMSRKDGLTGLYNHRSFQERLAEEFGRASRYGHDLTCVLLDVDYFKKVNDTYGHQAGDMILVSMATLLKNSIRDADIAARYGGEEFTLILPDTPSADAAAAICERIKDKIESSVFDHEGTSIKVTVSMGVAGVQENSPKKPGQLIKLADEALYRAKKEGRNTIIVSDAQL